MFAPKVSILIPVYNGANYMREAIDSALAQTYQNIEVIVINDGSTDASEEIALSYGEKIRYFAKENGGVATALNLGIEKMQGDYFSWLSHDDLYMPDKIKIQIEALQERNDLQTIVYSDFTEWNMEDGSVSAAEISSQFSKERLENSVFPVCFGLIHGCSLLIHKSHFQRAGVFDEGLRTTQDYDLWFRMFRGQRLIFVPEPLICSRLHAAQGTNTISCHQQERKEFFAQFFLSLSAEEMEELFGHPAMLYGRVENVVCSDGWTPEARAVQAHYETLTISESAQRRAERFRGAFEDMCRGLEQVCIFGCGMYGKWLYTFLSELGLSVRFFADNNPKQWGQKIGGCVCLSPEELRRVQDKTLIIAALQRTEPVLEQLVAMGCSHVTTKQAVDAIFLEAQR